MPLIFALLFLIIFSQPGTALVDLVAVGRSGQLYRLETDKNRLIKVSPAGTVQAGFNALASPQGLAVGPDGNIFIADTGNRRVLQLQDQGSAFQLIKVLPKPAADWQPAAMRTGNNGDLYISDRQSSKVWVYRPDGTYTAVDLGAGTSRAFSGSSPPANNGLAVDQAGNLYLTGPSSNKLQKFTPSGKKVMELGIRGTGRTKFLHPRDLAVDRSGNLFIADTGNNRIQKLDPDGKFLAYFGVDGRGRGAIYQPRSLDIGEDGYLYVTSGKGELVKYDITVRLPGLKADNPAFSPNGDKVKDRVSLRFTLDSDAVLNCYVYQGRLKLVVRKLIVAEPRSAGAQTIQWDGRDDAGRVVADGKYTLMLQAYTADRKRESAPLAVDLTVDTKPPLLKLFF